MQMQISIILPFIFLFLLFPSAINSVSILPESFTLFFKNLLFNFDPLNEGRTIKILNVHYGKYLFSKDFQESQKSKVKISFISNIYLFFKIANKLKSGRIGQIFPKIYPDTLQFNIDYELGLCKMLEYCQQLSDLMKKEKGEKLPKNEKRGSKKVNLNCSGGKINVKRQLKAMKDWIRETDFAMFLHFFYIPQNWEFRKMLRNYMNQSKDWEIDELKDKFVKLFGLARMVQLALHYPKIFGKMMNLDGNGQKEFEAEMMENLMKEYLVMKRPNNVIKKWTIRYTLNYFLYKQWWQKYEEENFKDKMPNPAKFWEKALKLYWWGENILRWEIETYGLSEMEGEEERKERDIKKAEKLFQDMEDNFLDTESFATDQLLSKGNYLEGAKEMTEQFWQFITTGIQRRENPCSKLKLEMNDESEMEQYWVKCVNANLDLDNGAGAENLIGQKEMCSEWKMNLMMEKGEEEVPSIYRDANFKELFNYEKRGFLKKFNMKLTMRRLKKYEEKNGRNAENKGKEPSIDHSIYPREKEKEIEEEIKKKGKEEIIEENEEGTKSNEKKDKKEKTDKSTKKDGNGTTISSGKLTSAEISNKGNVKKPPPPSSMAKKIEQSRMDEKARIEENEIRKMEAKKKLEKRRKMEEKEEKKEELDLNLIEKGKNIINKWEEIESVEKKYGKVMMRKNNGGGKGRGKIEEEILKEKIEEKEEKSLGEMMEQNDLKYLFSSIAKNEELIFDSKQIEKFYAIFIAEENEEKLPKLIEFMNIFILVKIIEQNFKTFSMVTEQGIPMGEWEWKLADWKEFKEEKLKNEQKGNMEEVKKEIFNKWETYFSKRLNNRENENEVEKEKMDEILGQMHFNELALMIGREATIVNEFGGIKMGDGEFEKNSRKYGEKMGEQFYWRLGRIIIPKMMIEIGGEEGEDTNEWKHFGQKFLNQIKAKMVMVWQQKLEKNIKEKFMKFIEMRKIYSLKMEPSKWMDPYFYEISSAENWPKINLENGKILEAYLEDIYEFNLIAEGMKENAKEWLRYQMDAWMAGKMANAINGGEVDYSMVIGGSSLVGAAMPYSDLDIIFLVPKLAQNPYAECLSSFFDHLRMAIDNEAEFKKFGLTKQDVWLRWIEPNARVPGLIKLQIDLVDLDIMMVQIPMEKISANLNGYRLKQLKLENAENAQNIRFNLYILDFLIEQMLNENEVAGGIHQRGSIYSLSSYRSNYRQKFVLIEKSRREIFTKLLQAVKLWTKRQHIYSNQFGYLSGTSLALMTTKICILYPTAMELPFLLEKFFFIYSTWPWPKPLILEELTSEEVVEKYKIKMEYWEPTKIELDKEMMPTITTMFPEGNAAFNVNEMGRNVIKSKMEKAYQMIIENEENGGNNNNFWEEQFFGEFDYEKYFDNFLLIICSAEELKTSTCGWVKNKIRQILSIWVEKSKFLKNVLEEYQIISDFERSGECVKIEKHECVGWLVGLKFASNLKENQRLKFWEDLKAEISMENYRKNTHKLEIFPLKSAELNEKISSNILEKKVDEMDEKKMNALKFKGKQKLKKQQNRPLNPNAEPYFPQYKIVQQRMSAFYSTFYYHYPQQFYYYPNILNYYLY